VLVVSLFSVVRQLLNYFSADTAVLSCLLTYCDVFVDSSAGHT